MLNVLEYVAVGCSPCEKAKGCLFMVLYVVILQRKVMEQQGNNVYSVVLCCWNNLFGVLQKWRFVTLFTSSRWRKLSIAMW